MKIGYPCINRSLDCKSAKTFRLKSYSETRLIKTVENNLNCLLRILQFNRKHGVLFFRITSDLIPFASHPICKFDWKNYFKYSLEKIGNFIKSNNMRISMHPDQFIVLNSDKNRVYKNSLRELEYHADLMDAMGLDRSAKIQLHVGGVYGDREKSLERFIERYFKLKDSIKRRLVIENDERSYSLKNCIKINSETAVPVLFDYYHHKLNNNEESIGKALDEVSGTWKSGVDGIPMVDYSSAKKGGRVGSHARTIDVDDFKNFTGRTEDWDFDLMLEIKDKEISALQALEILSDDSRIVK